MAAYGTDHAEQADVRLTQPLSLPVFRLPPGSPTLRDRDSVSALHGTVRRSAVMNPHRVTADSAVVSVRTSASKMAVGARTFAGRNTGRLSQERP